MRGEIVCKAREIRTFNDASAVSPVSPWVLPPRASLAYEHKLAALTMKSASSASKTASAYPRNTLSLYLPSGSVNGWSFRRMKDASAIAAILANPHRVAKVAPAIMRSQRIVPARCSLPSPQTGGSIDEGWSLSVFKESPWPEWGTLDGIADAPGRWKTGDRGSR